MKHQVYRLLIKCTSFLFPNTLVNIAWNKLSHPQSVAPREAELVLLSTAIKKNISFQNFDIATYHWPANGPKICLVHGWEGNAGNFAHIIKKLQKANFSIYAFDGPSHGASSRGKTSFFEFTDVTAFIFKEFDITHVISHSFGGVATTSALFKNKTIHIQKYIALTTPDRFKDRLKDVCQKLGINSIVKQKLISKIESEHNIKIDEINVSDFVKHINIEQALYLHDVNDHVIPISQTKKVSDSNPKGQFELIHGTGHFKILKDEVVIKRLVDFLVN